MYYTPSFAVCRPAGDNQKSVSEFSSKKVRTSSRRHCHVRTLISLCEIICSTWRRGWDEVRVFKTVSFYLAEYLSGDPKNHGWEMSESGWFTYEEAFGLWGRT